MLAQISPARLQTRTLPPPQPNFFPAPHAGSSQSNVQGSPTPSKSDRALINSTIAAQAARQIATDFVALKTLRFKISSTDRTAPENEDEDGGNPNLWRVAGIDFGSGMYNIVYEDTQDPIPIDREELIGLLTSSKLVTE